MSRCVSAVAMVGGMRWLSRASTGRSGEVVGRVAVAVAVAITVTVAVVAVLRLLSVSVSVSFSLSLPIPPTLRKIRGPVQSSGRRDGST